MVDNQNSFTTLIGKITTMNTQETQARADHKKLDTQIKALASRAPTNAKIAETAKNVVDRVSNVVSSA